MVVRDVADVALGALEVVIDALALGDVVRADPHLAARVRRRPADQVGRLIHGRLATEQGDAECCREA